MRNSASWLMLDTSGELFMIRRTREMGREMFLLSLSAVFADIFPGFAVQYSDTTVLVVVLSGQRGVCACAEIRKKDKAEAEVGVVLNG